MSPSARPRPASWCCSSRRRRGRPDRRSSPQCKVAVEDAFGNVVTSDTSTVTIAVASGPGGFDRRQHDQRGRRQRRGHVQQSGPEHGGQLHALRSATARLTSATTGNITVSPAAASQLVLQQSPTTGTAGQALGAVQAGCGRRVRQRGDQRQLERHDRSGQRTGGIHRRAARPAWRPSTAWPRSAIWC